MEKMTITSFVKHVLVLLMACCFTSLVHAEKRYYFWRGGELPTADGLTTVDLRPGHGTTSPTPNGNNDNALVWDEDLGYPRFTLSNAGWWSFNQTASAGVDMTNIYNDFSNWYLKIRVSTTISNSANINVILNTIGAAENAFKLTTALLPRDGTWTELTLSLKNDYTTSNVTNLQNSFNSTSKTGTLFQIHSGSGVTEGTFGIDYAYLTNDPSGVDEGTAESYTPPTRYYLLTNDRTPSSSSYDKIDYSADVNTAASVSSNWSMPGYATYPYYTMTTDGDADVEFTATTDNIELADVDNAWYLKTKIKTNTSGIVKFTLIDCNDTEKIYTIPTGSITGEWVALNILLSDFVGSGNADYDCQKAIDDVVFKFEIENGVKDEFFYMAYLYITNEDINAVADPDPAEPIDPSKDRYIYFVNDGSDLPVGGDVIYTDYRVGISNNVKLAISTQYHWYNEYYQVHEPTLTRNTGYDYLYFTTRNENSYSFSIQPNGEGVDLQGVTEEWYLNMKVKVETTDRPINPYLYLPGSSTKLGDGLFTDDMLSVTQNGTWVEIEIPLSAYSANLELGEYTDVNGSIFELAGSNPGGLSDKVVAVEYLYLTNVKKAQTRFIWSNNAVDSDWTNTSNWNDSRYPNSAADDVIIPKVNAGASYPKVPDEGATVNSITFQPGAEIGRQDLLTYDKAFVRYDFSGASSRDRWYMLSMPLQEAYSGDFTFGGYPFAYVRTFATETLDDGVTYAGWVPNKGNDTEFKAGDGFALWVESDDYTLDKGLGYAGGIIELPFYEGDRVSNDDVRYIHEYTGTDGEGTSTFYNFKEGVNGYEKSATSVDVTRSNAAYKLAGSQVKETLNFVNDAYNETNSSDFALAGNPFMTTINFTELVRDNQNVISGNYLIWSGKGSDNTTPGGFLGYNANGYYGISSSQLDAYIAPLQSFIVEKSATYNSAAYNPNDLVFNLKNISADATGLGTLKSAAASGGKIEITASNETASVLAFIANREYGDNILCNGDGRKLLSGLSDVPEVYTLKETAAGGKTAVGANIINLNGSMLIPVGLATEYAGEMSLSFSGMIDYDDYNIQLSDLKADGGSKVIDLTGKTDFAYTFNYTPPTDTNDPTEIIPDNERFVLSFSPKSATGAESTASDSGQALIYFRDNTLYAVSALDDLIYQLHVFDMQGRLLYAANDIQSATYTATGIQTTSDVCIVKLTTEKGAKSLKLVIR